MKERGTTGAGRPQITQFPLINTSRVLMDGARLVLEDSRSLEFLEFIDTSLVEPVEFARQSRRKKSRSLSH